MTRKVGSLLQKRGGTVFLTLSRWISEKFFVRLDRMMIFWVRCWKRIADLIHGLDTSFLVAIEIVRHPSHQAAKAKRRELLAEWDEFAITPLVLTEFMHIVTDQRRFPLPLTMDEAWDIAQEWWTAKDVMRVTTDEMAMAKFFTWHREHRLGRKRLQDTLLAATYRSAGIHSILTLNAVDFAVLGGFQCIVP